MHKSLRVKTHNECGRNRHHKNQDDQSQLQFLPSDLDWCPIMALNPWSSVTWYPAPDNFHVTIKHFIVACQFAWKIDVDCSGTTCRVQVHQASRLLNSPGATWLGNIWRLITTRFPSFTFLHINKLLSYQGNRKYDMTLVNMVKSISLALHSNSVRACVYLLHRESNT